MFGTIRRHQNWLWFLIIGMMIVGLLYWTDRSAPGSRGGSRGGKAPEIDGKTITPKMFEHARAEVRLIYYLNTHKWPEEDAERLRQSDWDEENQAYFRLLRAAKSEELGIHVSDEAIAAVATRMFGDLNIDRFVKEVLEPNHVTAEDLERFIRGEAALQQMIAVIGAAGRLITPAEAEIIYRREHQELAGDIVFFHASNYLSKVVITNGALTNWFGPQAARYRVPDRIRVSYVEFAKTNFLADADKQFATITNLDLQLRELYFKSGTNSFKDTNGVVLSESAAIAKIKEDQRARLALSYAGRKANEFANKLYDKQPLRAENLETLAKDEGLPVQVTVPFDAEQGPTNLNVSPKFAEIAFKLTPESPVSFQPIPGENGIYIIALKESIPGRPQSFEEVRDRVTDDYKRFNAFTLARNDATNFRAKATAAMAQGKTFDEAAQQSNLKAETLPPISQSTESLTNLEEQLNVRQLKSIMFSTEPGKLSSYIINPPDGGYIVHVRAKLPFEEAKLREELPKFTAELRYHKQNEIFSQWFRKQIDKEPWLRELVDKGSKAKRRGAS